MSNQDAPLRIIEFCDRFYPEIDGVVKVTNNYAHLLNQKHHCAVLVPQYKKYDDSSFSYEVMRKPTMYLTFRGLAIPFQKYSKKMKRKLVAYQADIYHVHSPFFIGHYALKAAHKNHIPVVATFHSKFKDDIMAVTKSRLLTRWILCYIIRFFNRCDEVWAPSSMSADTLRSYGYKKDIIVMENGTDFVYPTDVEKTITEARQLYHIQKENKNLLYVGQLRYVKNLKLVLETFHMLHTEDPSYQLYLAGEGPDEKSLRQFVKQHELVDSVHFVGLISDKEMLKGLYAASDLFFFPSTYDTFSIVAREASIMKTPSLLVKGSNAAEAFTDGVNGFVAENQLDAMVQKIKEIFQDDQKRKLVGEKASQDIPITWETMMIRVEKRYREIIEAYQIKEKKGR